MLILDAHMTDIPGILCYHWAGLAVPDSCPLDDDAISTEVLITTPISLN